MRCGKLIIGIIALLGMNNVCMGQHFTADGDRLVGRSGSYSVIMLSNSRLSTSLIMETEKVLTFNLMMNLLERGEER